jgi:hypothetical protein
LPIYGWRRNKDLFIYLFILFLKMSKILCLAQNFEFK